MAYRMHRSSRLLWLIASAGVCLALPISSPETRNLSRRAWGGFDQRPITEQCYRQERTATLLAVLLGPIAADQFYAQHWLLAIFKLIIALSSACWAFREANTISFGVGGLWILADGILWIVGGVYGTPGCGGTIWH